MQNFWKKHTLREYINEELDKIRGEMEMELVSIVVPVYNVENYLQECILSLVNQTYKNIEIILVDDGSSDSSGRICDQFAEKDTRVKVIHKINAGLGYARNSGLEIASGEYVTFIDSDDEAEKNLVELLMKAVHEKGVDTCVGGFKRINEDGKIIFREQYQSKIYINDDVYQKLFARMLGSDVDKHDAIKMSVWNVLYSMKIIRENNIRFPSERILISEDIIWDSEYYRYSRCAAIIESTAYNYRVTPGSLTQKYKPNRFEMVCKLYEVLHEKVKNNSDMKTRLQRQFFVNLRVCIHQENRAISHNDKRTYKNRLKEIINNEVVEKIVNEYPIKQIQFKQRIFISLVKYKMLILLMILNDLKII